MPETRRTTAQQIYLTCVGRQIMSVVDDVEDLLSTNQIPYVVVNYGMTSIQHDGFCLLECYAEIPIVLQETLAQRNGIADFVICAVPSSAQEQQAIADSKRKEDAEWEDLIEEDLIDSAAPMLPKWLVPLGTPQPLLGLHDGRWLVRARYRSDADRQPGYLLYEEQTEIVFLIEEEADHLRDYLNAERPPVHAVSSVLEPELEPEGETS